MKAIKTPIKILGGGGSESVTFRGVRLELPPPRCITDPRRSRRSLYIRLQTWLARLEWEAFRAGREEECRLLYGELHYIAHLLVRSVRACWLCPPDIRARFEVNRGRT